MIWWLYTIPFISAFIHWLTHLDGFEIVVSSAEAQKDCRVYPAGRISQKTAADRGESRSYCRGAGITVVWKILKGLPITNPENIRKILPLAEEHIDDFLRHKLKKNMPVIGMFIGYKTVNQLKTVFMEELETLFPIIMKNYVSNIKHDLDLEKIVAEKIANFSSERLEQMLHQILTKEFRFVEVIGAALGFFIGLLQIFITLLAK